MNPRGQETEDLKERQPSSSKPQDAFGMPIGSLKHMALRHSELMAALSKAEIRQPSPRPKEYELIEEIGKG